MCLTQGNGTSLGVLLLTDGTSHLLPIQQDGGTSLVCLTQENGMSLPLTDGTSFSITLPIACDVPRVPYSGQWDVPRCPTTHR